MDPPCLRHRGALGIPRVCSAWRPTHNSLGVTGSLALAPRNKFQAINSARGSCCSTVAPAHVSPYATNLSSCTYRDHQLRHHLASRSRTACTLRPGHTVTVNVTCGKAYTEQLGFLMEFNSSSPRTVSVECPSLHYTREISGGTGRFTHVLAVAWKGRPSCDL